MPFSRIILITCLLTTQSANSQDMRPADFDYPEADRRMDTLLEFPEISGNISVVMNCVSRIQANGKMEDTGCYLQNNYDEPFMRAIGAAARKARMNPAIVDGKAREIFLQFRVEFNKEGEQQTIDYYLNPGWEENVKAYGFRHVAGQRVIGRNEPWNDACPKRARWSLWVRAYLGPDGRAESPTLQHADGIMPTESCLNAIRQTIVASQYTPALADGEAVPSTFIEPFSN